MQTAIPDQPAGVLQNHTPHAEREHRGEHGIEVASQPIRGPGVRENSGVLKPHDLTIARQGMNVSGILDPKWSKQKSFSLEYGVQ
jgi:hypothetical protein